MHHPAHLGQAHPAGPRTNSASPMCASSAWICRDSDGCETCSTSAAWDAAVLGDTGEIHQLAQRRHRLRPVDDRETGIGHGQVHTPRWQHGSDRHGREPGRRDERPPAACFPKAVSAAEERKIGSGDDRKRDVRGPGRSSWRRLVPRAASIVRRHGELAMRARHDRRPPSPFG